MEPLTRLHHLGFAATRTLVGAAARATGGAVAAARHTAWYLSYHVQGRTGDGGPRPPRGPR